MTEDYAVQQKAPAGPYLLGGAALGATGGYFIDKIPGKFNGIPKSKYASFDDILKEKKDFFTKTENMSDELKEAASKIQTEREAVTTFIKENASKAKWADKVKTEGEALATKSSELKTAYKAAVDSIKANKDSIDALKGITDDTELTKAAKKYLQENMDKEEYKAVKEALTKCKEASKALRDKVKAEGAPAKVIDGLADKKTTAWEAVKEQAAKFKTGNKWLNAVAGGVLLAAIALAIRPKNKDA